MSNLLTIVLEKNNKLKLAKKELYSSIEAYLLGIDFKDIKSLEKAVDELPEHELKLNVYDAIYDLKEDKV